MIYYPQRINFREVYRGDTFHITLIISQAYQIKSGTHIIMQVRPTGDIPEAPILTFESIQDGGITVNGQELTFHKDPEDMQIRSGRYEFDIQFTTDNITSTLYRGLFEIIQDDSKIS